MSRYVITSLASLLLFQHSLLKINNYTKCERLVNLLHLKYFQIKFDGFEKVLAN